MSINAAQTDLIFTANQRLSRFLIEYMSSEQPTIRNGFIFTPEIFVATLWEELRDQAYAQASYTLLGPEAEAFIWRAIIQANPNARLLATEQLEYQLIETRKILENWMITKEEFALYKTDEGLFFIDLYQEFQERIQTKRLLTHEQATAIIINAYKAKVRSPYRNISTYGFSEMPPLIDTLLKSISLSQKYSVFELPNLTTCAQQQNRDKVYTHTADNVRDELTAAACWAKKISQLDPEANIAVIVPTLTSDLNLVKSQFEKVFTPSSYLHYGNNSYHQPYDISSGSPLLSTPVIHDIFSIFNLRQSEINKSEALAILHSPFWKGAPLNMSTRLTRWINSLPDHTVKTSQLLEKWEALLPTNEGTEGTIARRFHQTLQFRETCRKQKRQSLFKWNTTFKQYLKLLGWPGERTVSSDEYQAISFLFNQLDVLSSLDAHASAKGVSFDFYLGELTRLLSKTVFHTQTQKNNIHILGLIEGAGMQFDYCWIVGMTEKQMPSSPAPNPFIPYALQIKYSTPRSSYARELNYSQTLLDLYIQNSKDITLSYSRTEGAQDNHPSPLLKPFEGATQPLAVESNNSTITTDFDTALQDGIQYNNVEQIDDAKGKPLIKGTRLAGGTSHVRLHAVNPLYAYLVYRLGATPIEPAIIGVKASDRGAMLHLALANFWQKIQSHAKLAELIEQETLEVFIQDIVARVINAHFHSLGKMPGNTIINHEIERTTRHVCEFLELDAERTPFEVVGIEQKIQLDIDDIVIDMRMDRVDRMGNDDLVIIDYKTGSTSLKSLQVSPLLEPQLPLYLHYYKNKAVNVTGIGFAEISRKNKLYRGIGNDIEIKGFENPASLNKEALPSTWQDSLNWWEQSLTEEIKNISSGWSPNTTRFKEPAKYYDYLAPIIRQ